jgi:excisionase family DNA binding protein
MRFTPKRNYIKTVELPVPEGYYTVRECARYFHVTVDCVYKWIRQKKVNGVYKFRGVQAFFIPKNELPNIGNMPDKRFRKSLVP